MKKILASVALFALSFVACDGNGKPAQRAGTPMSIASPVAEPSETPLPVPSGALIFRGGGLRQDVFRVDADGRNPVNLSVTPAFDEPGATSPDGTLAAFSRKPDPFATGDLYVAQPNGSGEKQLTNTPNSSEFFISWSPDSQRILFGEFTEAAGQWSVMNRDGTGRIIVVPVCRNSCISPQWSPDGASLLAEIPTDGQFGEVDTGLFVISPDGSVQRELPDSARGWDEAIWSPDGEAVAYLVRERINDDARLFIMAADGGDLREVWSGEQPSGITWSPDGSRLAFSTDLRDIVLVDLDTPGSRVLASGGLLGGVSWSPDGRSIAFHNHGSEGDLDIFTIPASGGTPTNITRLVGDDFSPSWSRDGESIYFTSHRDSNYGIYGLNEETGDVTVIQRFTANDVRPEDFRLPPIIGGCEPLVLAISGDARAACLSQDNQRRARVEGVELRISNVATGSILARSPSDLRVEYSPPAWSHGGSRVAFIAGDVDDTYLHIMDVATGSIRRLVRADARANPTPTLLWSADDSSIYFTRGSECRGGCLTGFLYRVNADGTGEEQITDLRVQTLYGFAQ